MASLRSRLIAVLLVVAAAGMLVLALATYTEQRSFRYGLIDDQLQSALPALQHQLAEDAGRPDSFGGPALDRDDGPGPGKRPRPGEVRLPPGTYGERRDASGQRTGDPIVISYGESAPAAPDLPASLPLGEAITVAARGDVDLRYRVRAASEPSGGTIVAAVPLAEADETLDRLLRVEALVIVCVLIVLGIVASVLVRLSLRPLDRMGATAGAIAGGELSRRVSPATPKTEVGRLGLALNAMLDRLEDAFAKRAESEDRLRRFLADASHELRTPLASIRGYAELFRMGAAGDPADTDRAMRRVEEEAARMGVLVEDLLTLARLDELRDTVREPVDLAAVAGDAVEDARATAPDREITLRAGPDATVLADAHQVRQVLANLLGNALVHTPAGTPVEIDVKRAGADVQIDVRDHGPGLPNGDPQLLFDELSGVIDQIGPEAWREEHEHLTRRLEAEGVPPALARRHAFQSELVHGPDIITVSHATGRTVLEVARAFFLLGERLQLDWLEKQVEVMPRGSRWQRWALQSMEDDLFTLRRSLAETVLDECTGLPIDEAVVKFLESRDEAFTRLTRFMRTLAVDGVGDLARLTVALRQIRSLIG